jgi:hypothetical protein
MSLSSGETLDKKTRGEEEKKENTFERTGRTGGRKEATEDGRWLCLSFGFPANRGFGSK